MTTTREADAAGCGCLCYSLHPPTRDQCLHTGQVTITLQAARAGRTFPTRVQACRPCAQILSQPHTPTEPITDPAMEPTP